MDEKKCCHCGVVYPASGYYASRRYADGLARHCKQCQKNWNHLYRVKRSKRKLSLDHLDETLESILEEIREDVERVKTAKVNGMLGGHPDIKEICGARSDVFKSLLNDLFNEYQLTKKVLGNGTIERIQDKIKIRLKKRNLLAEVAV